MPAPLKPLSAIDSLGPAFQRAWHQLFQPFRFSFWWRMAVVALFAGEVNSFSFNFSVPSGNGGGGQNRQLAALASLWGYRDALPWILLLALAIVVLLCVLLYIHSVCRFILFDSVLTGRCRLGESWRRHQDHGLWFLAWLFIYECVVIAVLLAVVGLPVLGLWRAGIFAQARDHIALLVLTIFFLIVLFFVIVVIAWVVATMVRDFVVPIMALEDLSVVEAWRLYIPRLVETKASVAGYLGFKLLLTLGLGMIVAIVSFLVFFILLIPAVGFGLMVVGIAATGKLGLVIGIILGIVGAMVLLTLMFCASGTLAVPVAVFFQSYALYYVGSRYQRLGALLWPAPPEGSPGPGGTPDASPAPA